mmetsp:Transcript_4337/g.7024  ORF Transcript_4337/g.7024 Transcript_4337/m.7024 type:complete len:205 (-) Transcript_4337:2734-3348(-)
MSWRQRTIMISSGSSGSSSSSSRMMIPFHLCHDMRFCRIERVLRKNISEPALFKCALIVFWISNAPPSLNSIATSNFRASDCRLMSTPFAMRSRHMFVTPASLYTFMSSTTASSCSSPPSSSRSSIVMPHLFSTMVRNIFNTQMSVLVVAGLMYLTVSSPCTCIVILFRTCATIRSISGSKRTKESFWLVFQGIFSSLAINPWI